MWISHSVHCLAAAVHLGRWSPIERYRGHMMYLQPRQGSFESDFESGSSVTSSLPSLNVGGGFSDSRDCNEYGFSLGHSGYPLMTKSTISSRSTWPACLCHIPSGNVAINSWSLSKVTALKVRMESGCVLCWATLVFFIQSSMMWVNFALSSRNAFSAVKSL